MLSPSPCDARQTAESKLIYEGTSITIRVKAIAIRVEASLLDWRHRY